MNVYTCAKKIAINSSLSNIVFLAFLLLSASCHYEYVQEPEGTRLSTIAARFNMDIYWEPEKERAFLIDEENAYIFHVGKSIVYHNGKQLQMTVPATRYHGEIYISKDFLFSTKTSSVDISNVALLSVAQINFLPEPQEKEVRHYDIMLDPGHGGKDPGAANENIIEKNINLSLAKMVASKIKEKYHVGFTREDDEYISLEDRVTMAEKAKVFVSIHCNSSGINTASGYEIWVSFKNINGSHELAKNIEKEMIKLPLKNRSIRYNDFHVLAKSQIPAVLVECGFISNESDAAWLMDDKNRQKMAEQIATGISNFLESEEH